MTRSIKLNSRVLTSGSLAAGTAGTAQDTGIVWPDDGVFNETDEIIIDYVGRATLRISGYEFLNTDVHSRVTATAPAEDDDVDDGTYTKIGQWWWFEIPTPHNSSSVFTQRRSLIGVARDGAGKLLLYRDAQLNAHTGTVRITFVS